MSPCLVLAALCSPAIEPPAPVQMSVELRVTSDDDGDARRLEQSLRRGLSDRLLQEGYRVMPSGEAASLGVWVHLGREGARIETLGARPRSETVATGSPAVVELEVLQLTTALVDEARATEGVRPASDTTRPAVVVQLEGEALDPDVREHLQVDLLARGFALTRQPTPADQRLCMVAHGDELAIHVTAGDRACEADPATTRVTGAQLVDTATTALDAWTQAHATSDAPLDPTVVDPTIVDPALVDPAPAIVSPPALPFVTPLPSPAVAREAEPRATSVALTVAGGLVARNGGTDGAFGLRVRAGRRRGVGGGMELSVIPSAAKGVRVLEAMPTALLDWRIGFGRHGIAGFGAFAGLHVHRFTQAGPTGASGVRLGPSLGTTVRLAYLGPRGLLALGGLRAGWSGGQWIHVLEGETTWERSALLVALELGVGWDFHWRRRR